MEILPLHFRHKHSKERNTWFVAAGLGKLDGGCWLTFWNVLKARFTISLSPILSMINDFLVVVSDPGSELAGPKLRDMCKDVGSIRLLSGLLAFLLVTGVWPFSFLTKGRVVDLAVFINSGFDDLGVDIMGDFVVGATDLLGIGDACFFWALAVLVVFFTKVV